MPGIVTTVTFQQKGQFTRTALDRLKIAKCDRVRLGRTLAQCKKVAVDVMMVS
jgi:hypothetical protein